MPQKDVRVLVVDDDAGVRRALQTRLSAAGYQVDAVSCGPEALAACAVSPPQVAILDVSLPGMDGYQICERLRETVDDPIVVIFLTGTTHAGTTACSERLISQSGGDYYLAKPYDPGLLLELIDEVVQPSATPRV